MNFLNSDRAHYKYALDNNRKLVKIRSDKFALYYNGELEYYFSSARSASDYIYTLTVIDTAIEEILVLC